MTLQVTAPMRFFHERYLGRPSCPKCGELMVAPEYPEFTQRPCGDEVRNFWLCDGCDYRFDTLVKFEAVAA
jgi:C4-type Zn-finger protein